MKCLFALYDKDDNFIDCGFSLKEIGVRQNYSWHLQHARKKYKLFRIPLTPKNDIFEKEDKIFIEEELINVFTIKELAEMLAVSERTIYRKKLDINYDRLFKFNTVMRNDVVHKLYTNTMHTN